MLALVNRGRAKAEGGRPITCITGRGARDIEIPVCRSRSSGGGKPEAKDEAATVPPTNPKH